GWVAAWRSGGWGGPFLLASSRPLWFAVSPVPHRGLERAPGPAPPASEVNLTLVEEQPQVPATAGRPSTAVAAATFAQDDGFFDVNFRLGTLTPRLGDLTAVAATSAGEDARATAGRAAG